MAVWIVRAGRHGEREATALDNSIVVIGWGQLPDLTPITTREELEALCRETYSQENPKTVTAWIAQVWAFRGRIDVGDLVVLPLKTRSAIAIGRVVGPYQNRPDLPEDARHSRPVEWIDKEIPRSAFDQDILFSFGSALTVCQVQRNQAELRIRAFLDGKPAPVVASSSRSDGSEATVDTAAPFDVEQYARDQIRAHIEQKLKGHGLARLVDEILKAQGYRTQLSPPGVDAGVDIIAGGGPMGFDPPRLCVQVKSSSSPVDVTILRELQGVMDNFNAHHGLLVSWGGFKSSVLSEARRRFFQIRLWDADDLLTALQEHYHRLPEDLQSELPLKRIWTLVTEEQA